MQKKEKKMLYQSLFIFILCITSGLSIAVYYITPKDKLETDVKEYYINTAIDYFSENNKNIVSIKTLIKTGYATEKKEFTDYGCNKSSSYIEKENDIITFRTSCKNYTKDYKIKEG